MFARNRLDARTPGVERAHPAFEILGVRAEVVFERLDRDRARYRFAVHERAKDNRQIGVAVSGRVRGKPNFHGRLIRRIRRETDTGEYRPPPDMPDMVLARPDCGPASSARLANVARAMPISFACKSMPRTALVPIASCEPVHRPVPCLRRD